MKKYLYISIVLTTLLGACSPISQTNENDSIVTITIDNPQQEDKIQLSDYFKSAQVIPLETTADCLIGEIQKVDVDDDLLFVFDNSKKGVYCFSKEGKFLHRIGNLGNGPKELPDIKCFTLDKKKKIIYLHSRIVRKLVAYRYNGEFIEEEPCGYCAYEIEEFKNRIYLSATNGSSNEYDIVGRDDKGKIVERYIPSRDSYVSCRPKIRRTTDKLYYYPDLMRDTIYALDGEGSFEPAIIMKAPGHEMPDHVWEKLNYRDTPSFSPQENAMEIIRNGYVMLSDYAVFPNFIYLSFSQGQVYWGFYDCKQKDFVSSYDIRDDLTTFGCFHGAIGQTETQLLACIKADYVSLTERQLQDKEKYMKTFEHTEEQWKANVARIEQLRKQGVEDDSNPILIIYTVK